MPISERKKMKVGNYRAVIQGPFAEFAKARELYTFTGCLFQGKPAAAILLRVTPSLKPGHCPRLGVQGYDRRKQFGFFIGVYGSQVQ